MIVVDGGGITSRRILLVRRWGRSVGRRWPGRSSVRGWWAGRVAACRLLELSHLDGWFHLFQFDSNNAAGIRLGRDTVWGWRGAIWGWWGTVRGWRGSVWRGWSSVRGGWVSAGGWCGVLGFVSEYDLLDLFEQLSIDVLSFVGGRSRGNRYVATTARVSTAAAWVSAAAARVSASAARVSAATAWVSAATAWVSTTAGWVTASETTGRITSGRWAAVTAWWFSGGYGDRGDDETLQYHYTIIQ